MKADAIQEVRVAEGDGSDFEGAASWGGNKTGNGTGNKTGNGTDNGTGNGTDNGTGNKTDNKTGNRKQSAVQPEKFNAQSAADRRTGRGGIGDFQGG